MDEAQSFPLTWGVRLLLGFNKPEPPLLSMGERSISLCRDHTHKYRHTQTHTHTHTHLHTEVSQRTLKGCRVFVCHISPRLKQWLCTHRGQSNVNTCSRITSPAQWDWKNIAQPCQSASVCFGLLAWQLACFSWGVIGERTRIQYTEIRIGQEKCHT